MVATLVDLAQNLDIPKKGVVVAAPVAKTDLVALLGGPARQLIVDTISGTLVVTQRDGTTLTFSANHLTALRGIVDHVCTHIQSAACTGIMARR